MVAGRVLVWESVKRLQRRSHRAPGDDGKAGQVRVYVVTDLAIRLPLFHDVELIAVSPEHAERLQKREGQRWRHIDVVLRAVDLAGQVLLERTDHTASPWITVDTYCVVREDGDIVIHSLSPQVCSEDGGDALREVAPLAVGHVIEPRRGQTRSQSDSNVVGLV